MDLYRKAMKEAKAHEILLGSLFTLYAAMDIQTPDWLEPLVNNKIGNIIIAVIALSMFLYVSPVLAVLACIAAYELIRRSDKSLWSHSNSMIGKLPDMPNDADLTAYNQFSKTLEEEMVGKMAPLVGPSSSASLFRPEMESSHGAASTN